MGRKTSLAFALLCFLSLNAVIAWRNHSSSLHRGENEPQSAHTGVYAHVPSKQAKRESEQHLPLADGYTDGTSKQAKAESEQHFPLADGYTHGTPKLDKTEDEQRSSFPDGYTHVNPNDHQQDKTQNGARSSSQLLGEYTHAASAEHQGDKRKHVFSSRSTLPEGGQEENADYQSDNREHVFSSRSTLLDGGQEENAGHQGDNREHVFSSRSTLPETGQEENAGPYVTVSPPLTLLQPPDCSPVEETRTERSGLIAVKETQEDCNTLWTWKIQAPSADHGIVVQFHDVHMRHKCSLRVFTSSEESDRVEQRVFTSSESDYSNFSPLLLRENQALVVLNTPYDSYKYSFSTVNITYEIHPKATMPYAVIHPSVPSTSVRMYNCSGLGVRVPSALRCDMVQQCVLDEDEEVCDYRKRGCGEWIPYGDQCLKMEFVTTFTYIPGQPQATFPSEASKTCKDKHGGQLALLMDFEGIHLAAKVLRQSGHSSAVVGIRKVKPMNKRLRHLYRYLWQWGGKGSPIAYEQQQIQRDGPLLDCATLDVYPTIHLHPLRCVLPDLRPDGYVCMRPNPGIAAPHPPTLGVSFPRPSRRLERISTRECPDGSLVQVFHECPSWVDGRGDFSGKSPNNFPLFQCRHGPPVHYALVCDGFGDCADGSDEMFCGGGGGGVKFPPLLSSTFACDRWQLVSRSQRCDGVLDCFDESDEVDCTACTRGPRTSTMCTGVGCVPDQYTIYIESCPTGALFSEGQLVSYHPSVVSLDGFGMSRLIRADVNSTEGMFRCSDGDYIPSFLLNNLELDCKFGEDENIPADNLTCPGFYRCYLSGQCVHPDFVCDGVYHCSNKDDERYCDVQCPADCVCEGYAFSCSRFFNTTAFLHARYLDLSGAVDFSLNDIHFLELLLLLNLSHCNLEKITLVEMPQLRILDLSFNELKNLSSLAFERLTGLWFLNMSGNPLVQTLDSSFTTFIEQSGLTGLKQLSLRNTGISLIEDRALSALTELKSLDLRDNRIDVYRKDIFWALGELEQLLTDDSKLCCSYFHQSLRECLAPFDELSSCSDLLRVDFFRVFLWLISMLAIVGNASVVLYRVFSTKKGRSPVFGTLVCNLCGADFLMGVYLMIIGIADAQSRGVYVAWESAWRQSWACTIAGFLGFVSSEVSALVICVITLERLLVLCFPLKSNLHLQRRSAFAVCCAVWFLGVTLAALPLAARWEFYGESSICLPLPITRRRYSGQPYAFGVFIVVNFVLFLLIGVSQALIYRVVGRASRAAGAQRRQQEMAVARRLFIVVFTDFCCWFPVGVMGLMAAAGTPIPGEVNVWTAIFVLPLNSALNPFLYTLNSALEKWRQEGLKRRAKKVLGNMQAELNRLQPSAAEEVVRVCVRSGVVRREKMLQWLQLRQDSNVTSFSGSECSTDKAASTVVPDTTSINRSKIIQQ